jgi:hypothetical protein
MTPTPTTSNAPIHYVDYLVQYRIKDSLLTCCGDCCFLQGVGVGGPHA